jgi:predicted RNA-binding Zn ribbon-like protein
MVTTDPFGDVETKPAPGALGRIQALINTRDVETGADLLAEPASAQRWLEKNQLSAGGPATSDDIDAVVAVREALRAMAVHNAGGPEPAAETLRGLAGITAHSTARAVVEADGVVRLEPAADTVHGRLLGVLLTVRDAQADGTWAKLKACANPDCQWAFYDRSRNRGGTWCDMAGCGNKLKNRDFRARRRQSG